LKRGGVSKRVGGVKGEGGPQLISFAWRTTRSEKGGGRGREKKKLKKLKVDSY